MAQDPETITHGDSLTPERFARVRAIFEAALERPPAERRAYAAGACAGDAGLLAEVERMLAAEGKTGMLPREKRPSTTSASAPEDGRFAAGSMLAERYRILGLLGRGGMGEVYRAYDTKLAQTVALKFLPLSMAGNARAMDRFRNEVRIARQVSHRNVCRVYDLGEADGMPFLSMEYIDGEDLRLLLRRIGRLPGDKAIEIARKLCAGLAAAHEKGVLHRDLKPANIMIDSQGQVMITDFGLAAAADAIAGADVRSGTPAYMAPEQKEGREVTVRSDLYSLGLIFAEMFTGQGASRDGTLSATVKDLDPVVERAIERCLDPNPSRRPDSALALARLLPGGDPLAEALAAGDTPTPAMVAASEEQGVLSVRACFAYLASIVVVYAAAMWLVGPGVIPLPDPPELMQRKSRALLETLGYENRSFGVQYSYIGATGYREWREHFTPPQRREQDVKAQPANTLFWYREGPEPLPGVGLFGLRPDLPPNSPDLRRGDIDLHLDPLGRLVYLFAMPSVEEPEEPMPRPLDWDRLFAAAGLDQSRWAPVDPVHRPATAFDARAAWTGSYAHLPDVTFRIEAAAWQGRPVFFQIAGPWRAPESGEADSSGLLSLFSIGILLAGGLAWRNYRAGRIDVSGAWQLSAFVFAATVLAMLCWRLAGSDEDGIPLALSRAAGAWLLYVALEPFVRRRWPQSLISWTRLSTRGWRDALVGSHLLAGVALGVFFGVSSRLLIVFESGNSVAPTPNPINLRGLSMYSAMVLDRIVVAAFVALMVLFAAFLLRSLLRRVWLAAAAGLLLAVVFAWLIGAGTPIGLVVILYITASTLFIVLRFGLLTSVVSGWVALLSVNFRYDTDFSAWQAPPGILMQIATLAIAMWAFRIALGGRKVFQGDWLER